MTQRAHETIYRLRACALALVLAWAAGLCGPAHAAETASENAQLAMLLRQLDTLERLAQDASALRADGATRYHFDYARLHADIARIRAGIQDYLTPPRAQPRDGELLIGQYRTEKSAMENSAMGKSPAEKSAAEKDSTP